MLNFTRHDPERGPKAAKLVAQVDPDCIAAVEDLGDHRMITLTGQNAAVRVTETIAEIEKARKGK